MVRLSSRLDRKGHHKLADKMDRAAGFHRSAGYSTQMGDLRHVLKEGYDPWDYEDNLPDFLNKDHEEVWEGPNWFDNASQDDLDAFREYNEKNQITENDPLYAPPYESLVYEGDSPSMNWQVHFTNEPWDIASSGFKYGHPDTEGVHLTTWKKDRTKKGGFNFAFDVDRTPNESNYGKHAVIFPSGAIETYHSGDEEHQNIFWGPTVDPRMIFPVTKEEVRISPEEDQAKGLTRDPKYGYGFTTDMWVVRDWNERQLFKSENIRDCVGWIERNWRQLLSTREKIEGKRRRRR